jgi:poly(hydroxyalkanoate) depolymerase family esterase
MIARAATRAVAAQAVAATFPLGLLRHGVTRVAAFGSNPGELEMLVYAPPGLRPGRPLVVVLHGCGQDAPNFAAEAGWIGLARSLGLALLIPEQAQANNRNRCFNWFRPEDVRRSGGEAMSIRQMVRTAAARFGSDKQRIFIVGFSAGGGMAAAMLAAYPAVFAAGAVVAGMPVGSARTMMGAMMHMRRADRLRSRASLADDVRLATRTRTRQAWPRLSIWQGGQDRTVDPHNAELLAAQWSELHGQGSAPAFDEVIGDVRRRCWGRPDRRGAVELTTIAAMGHGFPVDTATPGGGTTGAWVVDTGVSAVRQIAAFWGLERAGRG